MCGVIGYTGSREALPILLDGLKRLEYRGYDSSGICLLDTTGKASWKRASGRLSNLEDKLPNQQNAKAGIAHIRWATHGEPTEENAHPHSDCDEQIFVVHNGIIENYRQLKQKLEASGHTFRSETDTEIIPHLIEAYQKKKGSLADAVHEALKDLRGAFSLLVQATSEPGTIIAARRSSPLVLGVGKNNEHFVASDGSPLIPHTKEVIYLNDDELVVMNDKEYDIRTFGGQSIARQTEELDWSAEEAEKGGFDHFMQKEIAEVPDAITNALRGRLIASAGNVKLGGLELVTKKLRDIKALHLVACGSAYYAAMTGALMLQEYAKLPVSVTLASEFRYRDIPLDKKSAVLAISQSGETADTLAAVREAKRRGLLTLGLVNVVGSTIARETGAGVYNHAGPEIGVASTKAYISQLTVLALLSVFLGRQRVMSITTGQRIVRELKKLPSLAKEVLQQETYIKTLAKELSRYQNFLFIGRKYNYSTALEGALKLKEISYRHAEGYAGGELKHGALALIDEQFPTIAIATNDSVYEKMCSNLAEIKARRGPLVAIATAGDQQIDNQTDDIILVPKTLEMLSPIITAIPLHLLAYHLAVALDRDVDRPRNLAKSVTVE